MEESVVARAYVLLRRARIARATSRDLIEETHETIAEQRGRLDATAARTRTRTDVNQSDESPRPPGFIL